MPLNFINTHYHTVFAVQHNGFAQLDFQDILHISQLNQIESSLFFGILQCHCVSSVIASIFRLKLVLLIDPMTDRWSFVALLPPNVEIEESGDCPVNSLAEPRIKHNTNLYYNAM